MEERLLWTDGSRKQEKRYFKDSLNELVKVQVLSKSNQTREKLPDDFLINHISGSFVEMVQWWLKGHRRQSPQELDQYFRAVIEPIFISSAQFQSLQQ